MNKSKSPLKVDFDMIWAKLPAFVDTRVALT